MSRPITLNRIVRKVRRMVRGPIPGETPPRLRDVLSYTFVRGGGLEIGALQAPLSVAPDVRVRYVDRMTVAELRRVNPNLDNYSFVHVDIVDDGEKLATVPDGSQDFVIANHFIEHTQDPIGTLRRFLAVLRPGGVVYMAVPDRRYTFDKDRPETTVEHLIRDHEDGPAWSYRDHCYEFSRLVHKFEGAQLESHVHAIIRDNYNIHFHVWTHDTFQTFLAAIRERYGLPFSVAASVLNRPQGETICVLERI